MWKLKNVHETAVSISMREVPLKQEVCMPIKWWRTETSVLWEEVFPAKMLQIWNLVIESAIYIIGVEKIRFSDQ